MFIGLDLLIWLAEHSLNVHTFLTSVAVDGRFFHNPSNQTRKMLLCFGDFGKFPHYLLARKRLKEALYACTKFGMPLLWL